MLCCPAPQSSEREPVTHCSGGRFRERLSAMPARPGRPVRASRHQQARKTRGREKYIEDYRSQDVPTNRLFLSLKRRPHGDYAPLTCSGVNQLIATLAEQAGIRKRTYPHLLRHSYATWALSRGMNPVQLADILGHASMTMIKDVYSHLAPHDAYDAQMKILNVREEE